MEKWSRYQPLIQNWGSSMIHAAFTIQDKIIHIILKNSAGRVIHHGMIRSERCTGRRAGGRCRKSMSRRCTISTIH